MYLQITTNEFYFYSNIPNLPDQGPVELKLVSKMSNKLFPQGATTGIMGTWVGSNDRCSLYHFNGIDQFWSTDTEANGIYNYQLVSVTGVVDEGIARVFNGVGNTPTINTYISDNDSREAVIYFEN